MQIVIEISSKSKCENKIFALKWICKREYFILHLQRNLTKGSKVKILVGILDY